jgi:hypothetical protein
MMENMVQTTQEKKTFEPLPVGDYKARLIEVEIKPNKAGTGTNANAHFEIVNGDYKKRRLFHCFLVEHPNEKAIGFSNNKLNKFLAAAGTDTTIEDMGFDYSQLMDVAGEIPFIAAVGEDEYINGAGETVSTNKILTFKGR